MTTPTKVLQREALTYVTLTLLETGKAPTMAQLRDHLGLKSRNSAHTIVLALEAAGDIVVTRFAIALPGMVPATYEEGLGDGRAQGLASLDVLPGEEAWARSVLTQAKTYRGSMYDLSQDSAREHARLIDLIGEETANQKST